jgi:hypothetical protein
MYLGLAETVNKISYLDMKQQENILKSFGIIDLSFYKRSEEIYQLKVLACSVTKAWHW